MSGFSVSQNQTVVIKPQELNKPKSVVAPSPTPVTPTPVTPTQTPSPSSGSPSGGVPPLLAPERVENLQQRIAVTPEREIAENGKIVPKPALMLAAKEKITQAQGNIPKSDVKLMGNDVLAGMIKTNFTGLVKDIDSSLRKGHYRGLATQKATQMLRNAPPGSDLTMTVMLKTDAELKEIVAQGMGEIKAKHKGKSYAQLPENKQKLVDAIVAGMKAGLPTDQRLKQQALKDTAHVSPESVASKDSLMSQIRAGTALKKGPVSIAELDQRAHKGIDIAAAKLKEDAKALKEKTAYTDVPKAVRVETSGAEIGAFIRGTDRLPSYTPSEIKTIKENALNAMRSVPEQDKNKLMWTLSMKSVSEIQSDLGGEVFKNLDGSKAKTNPAQAQMLKEVAQALFSEALDNLAKSSTDTVTKKDALGDPETVKIKGKTYTAQKVLGEGGFGKAILFQSEDGHQVVLKRFKQKKGVSDEKWFGNMQTEIRSHREAMGPDGKGHGNVLKLEGVVFQPNPKNGLGEFFTVTEVAGGGEMGDVVNTLNTQRENNLISPQAQQLLSRYMLSETMKGMLYVQRDRQMIHLDIKPENVFMTKDGDVKVADFGLAKATSGFDTKMYNAGGTAGYMSPEVSEKFDGRIDDKDQKVNVDHKSDTWSLGILARKLMTGRSSLPTNKGDAIEAAVDFGKDVGNRMYKVGGSEHREGRGKVDVGILTGYEQVVNSMLDPDPSKRPTLEAIASHELFNDPALANPRVKAILKELMQIKPEPNEYGLTYYSPQEQETLSKLSKELETIAQRGG
jgi:serine/threonine protein kinase